MRALVLDSPKPIQDGPLRMAELEVPQPSAGQVVIRVEACGVCRSNLHMIEGEWTWFGIPAFTPIVPGHEVVGRISALGPGVSRLHEGDRVGVQPLWSTCGWCEYCLSARENLCFSKQTTGETVHGGYAEYLLATAEHVYPVPDELSSVDAAPMFCPGITAYSAVQAAQLRPGQTVAVFGLGGVGHMVLQFAGLTGAEVIAVARGAQHLQVARELGASRTIDSTGPDVEAELQRDGGVDAAIVFAPSDEVMRQALRTVKRGGRLVTGVIADVGRYAFFDSRTLVGSVIGNRRQMLEVLALAAAGAVRSVNEVFALEQANDALLKLKRGELASRAVLRISG